MQRPQFRFVFDGTKYEYLGYVGAPDALLIKMHSGLGVRDFFNGIVAGEPASLVALVFIAKRHAGEDVEWFPLVESMVGENDLLALVDSLEDITATPAADAPPVEINLDDLGHGVDKTAEDTAA